MLIVGALVMAFVAGLLIGAVIAHELGFNEGRKYGYQQGCERLDDLDRLDRIRSMM